MPNSSNVLQEDGSLDVEPKSEKSGGEGRHSALGHVNADCSNHLVEGSRAVTLNSLGQNIKVGCLDYVLEKPVGECTGARNEDAPNILNDDQLILALTISKEGDGFDTNFDPMVCIEALSCPPLVEVQRESLPNMVGYSSQIHSSLGHLNGCPPKRPRGRLKKKALLQPEVHEDVHPVSRNLLEAHNTWNTAKLLGITSNDENKVISHLRKSKRLLNLEESSP